MCVIAFVQFRPRLGTRSAVISQYSNRSGDFAELTSSPEGIDANGTLSIHIGRGEIESLWSGGSVAGLSDRQLIERFNTGRDAAGEAAFAALVSRHGPMVLNICGQLLGDHHHAEDACQAVFLVLAGKAQSIREPDLLANWLYGVALRTSRCARQELFRRRKNEEGGLTVHPPSGAFIESGTKTPDQAMLDREQAEALHGELERLPSSFRLPVVLCYFEGLTVEEAAKRLRAPDGTVPQPAGQGEGKAPPPFDPSRRRVARCAVHRRYEYTSVVRIDRPPAVRDHDESRDQFRGRPGCARLCLGLRAYTRQGDSSIGVLHQAAIGHRYVRASRRCSVRRGALEAIPGQDG